ncbi:transcription elongation factor GreA [Patescibacteria group bacterium]|nr:transcription elongation factor GreA [Patescibacteria group bacterium]
MERLLVTKKGLKKLEDELNYLKTTKRKEIARRIEEAKEYGDISENSEYEDAKNEQVLVESKIMELKSMIKNSSLISGLRVKGRVGYGSRVKVSINNSPTESDTRRSHRTLKIFEIVGSVESDPVKGKISGNSPLAKALIGLKKGEEAEVRVPHGVIKYKVLEIK